MTVLYKLTDKHDRTYGGCQWGKNVTHTASGNGALCTAAWLHAYTHPVLAHMLNPIHANFVNPQLWECEGTIGATDNGLKVGCTCLTTLRRLDIMPPTFVNRIAFAIGCAYNAYSNSAWRAWAKAWVIDGKRAAAAAAAYAAAAAAAYAAYDAAAYAYAADIAAADAAAAAATAASVVTVADVAYAAAAAADAAAAARAALPLTAIVEWAMTVK